MMSTVRFSKILLQQVNGYELFISICDVFQTTTDPVALELYKRKVIAKGTTVNFIQPKIGLEKVRKGGYAFQVSAFTISLGTKVFFTSQIKGTCHVY